MSLTTLIAGMADDSIFAANKNVIINGNFDIWQRGTSFTSVSSGDFSADRWAWAAIGTGNVDILQSTSVPNNTSDFSLQVDVITADTSIAAGDIYDVRNIPEGYDIMRFAFGTSDAKQFTLSFWVKSSKTGIHCVAFHNAGNDRSFPAEYTVNVADTWEFKTITITADTTGTWLTDNGRGVQIIFVLAVGSTFQGTADTWQAGQFFGTSNQVNVMDSTANNFHLSRVQLEVGSTATTFERRSFHQELSMAQRYYYRLTSTNSAFRPIVSAYGQGSTNVRGLFRYPVVMRAIPTFSLSAASDMNLNIGGVNKVPSAVVITAPHEHSTIIDWTSTGITIGVAGQAGINVADGWLAFDAEL